MSPSFCSSEGFEGDFKTRAEPRYRTKLRLKRFPILLKHYYRRQGNTISRMVFHSALLQSGCSGKERLLAPRLVECEGESPSLGLASGHRNPNQPQTGQSKNDAELKGGELFYLQLGFLLLTVKLLGLQSLKAIIRRTFPL